MVAIASPSRSGLEIGQGLHMPVRKQAPVARLGTSTTATTHR